MNNNRFTMRLIEASIEDIDLVGGKSASLGEMLQHLKPLGVNIPDGFIVTSQAYFQFITYNQLDQKIKDILKGVDSTNLRELTSCGGRIRTLIQQGIFSPAMEEEILA
ncbi:MAG: PEP/pyruvate-binding domain-containing protein, partial [Sphingobacterium sp.]